MSRWFVAAVAMGLAAASLPVRAGETGESARRKYRHGDLRKLIAVVKTPAPPTIDGIMQPGEWDAAAALSGLTVGGSAIFAFYGMENVAADQSTFWVTYDDEKLYIAHHSPPPARIKDNNALIPVMLKRTVTQHDSNVDWDDSIRISIVEPYPYGDEYWIYVNALGTTYEVAHDGYHCYRAPGSKLKGINLSWDPKVANASTLTLDGWTLELAIPWKDLGPHLAKPAPGGVLHMNFVRLWQEVMKQSHVWKMFDMGADSELEPKKGEDGNGQVGINIPAGEVLFQGDEGVVVQLDDAGYPPRGRAAFKARILNRSAKERKVVAAVATDSGELKDRKELSLPPNGSLPYAFEGRVVNTATTWIAFSVTDAAGSNAYHVTTLPVIRPTRPGVYARRYRSRDAVAFDLDLTFMGAADLAQARVALDISDPRTSKELFRKTFEGFASYDPSIELATKGWAAGNYDAHFVFTAPGMQPFDMHLPHRHAPLPEWWNNRYGFEDVDTDTVPYPWTDMHVTNDTIGVWGREYRFGGKFYPEQIMTLGQPMLRAPMRVVLKTADGQVVDTAVADVKAQWTKTSRTHVEAERAIENQALKLKNSVWADYDGFFWSTLRLEPHTNVTIAAMELEIPLTKAFSDVINTHDYSLRGTGKLKPEGFAGPLHPVWLGNADGGIQWFSETDGFFFVNDPKRVVRVEVTPEGAALRIVMIDVPTDLAAPHEISFGFMTTPVRPKTWRTPEYSGANEQGFAAAGGGPWFPQGLEFMPAADPGTDYYSGGAGGRLYLHLSPANIGVDAAGSEDYENFGDEWLANAAERPAGVAQTTQASKSYRDYYVWRHWRYQKKYGYAGLYYDSPNEVMTANTNAGAIYRRRDGTVATMQPILGTREMMKRLYNVTLSNPKFEPRKQPIGVHQSGMPHMAYLGFGTYNWDGENFNSIINSKQPTYRGVMEPATFRAEYMGHNFGWPLWFLGQGRLQPEWVAANGGPEAVIDQLSGLVVLHDQGGNVGWQFVGANEGVCQRMNDAFARHQLNHWVYQFLPYWKQDVVTLPRENMYASFFIAHPKQLLGAAPEAIDAYFERYQSRQLPEAMRLRNRQAVAQAQTNLAAMKNKAVLVVYNDGDWSGELRLKPNWSKLGFASAEGLKAENAIHSTGFRVDKAKNEKGEEVEKGVLFPRPEEYAKIEGEEVIFPMTPWNYRMIVLEQK
ncbi:MAG: DUF6067 family protein [Kiritimatiellae bacterium]|nr:DUF6067 family protein [Kiritimatiellia bacterium]